MTDETNPVSKRRGAQKGPKTSETRYRRLFETARDGILILNAVTGKIIDANPFMVELLGYSRREFLGKELWEIGVFDEKEASQAAFRELQQKGYIRYQGLPLETKRGVRREVEFVSNVYQEAGQQVIQCNIRDITERKRAERAQRESEQRFHVLVAGVKDYAVFMLDASGHVTSWNTGVELVLGYDEVGFLGQHFSCIFTPEDIRTGEPERELRTAEAEGEADNERWRVRKDGTRIWATGTVTPLLNETRRLHGFAVVMGDNTQRRLAEERTAHEAAHDNLTGLPNRAFFTDHLKRAIARSKPAQRLHVRGALPRSRSVQEHQRQSRACHRRSTARRDRAQA